MFFFPRIFFRLSLSSLLFIIFAIGLKSPAPKPVPHRAQPRGWRVGMTHLCSQRKLRLIIKLWMFSSIMFLLKTPAAYLLLMVSSFRLKKKKKSRGVPFLWQYVKKIILMTAELRTNLVLVKLALLWQAQQARNFFLSVPAAGETDQGESPQKPPFCRVYGALLRS